MRLFKATASATEDGQNVPMQLYYFKCAILLIYGLIPNTTIESIIPTIPIDKNAFE